MAQNPITHYSIAELLDTGGHCNAGLGTHGAPIGILQYTQANYNPFVTALQTKQGTFITARGAYAAAVSDVMDHRTLMYTACLDARLFLIMMVSREWTEAWTTWGWEDGTTEVPRDLAGLKALCLAIKNGLTANTDYVMEGPLLAFTPERYNTLLTALPALEAAVTAKKVALGIARDARTADETALRHETRGLIDLLASKLDPDSPLWDAFGLNRPGAEVTPEAPAAPTLTKIVGGNVLAQTGAVALASYYRWFAQLVGVDTDFRFLGRTDDPTKVIDDLPANGTLKVKCEAANEAGPGTASEVTTLVLGV